MKIIILGDLHLGARNNSEIMMYHQSKFFEFLFKYCKDNNISTILQLGDCFDSRKNINLRALQFSFETLFDKLEQNNIDFYTIIGNHDVFYKETLDITSSDLMLRNYDKVHVYDQPETVGFDGISFDLIPWICNENREAITKYIENSKSSYTIGHYEINGFKVFNDTMFEGGMTDKQLFKNYKQVFSGHFHLKSQKDNITYVGTPYQLNWSDANDNKGFIVFDTKDESWNYVYTNQNYYHYITYDDSHPGLNTDLNKVQMENSFIKIIVKNKTKPFLYNTYLNRIFNSKPADVKIVEQSIIDKANNIISEIKAENTLDLINDYVDHIDYDKKDQLKQFMNQLYNEAQQAQDDIE